MPNIDMGKIVAAGKRCGLTKAVLVEWAQKSPLAECGCLRPTKAPRERAL
mgnify:CR=1 FL=1